MDKIAIELPIQDYQTLLNLLEATSFQGKEGAVQYLRIFHALESALVDKDE
jgi:hypothetical protein|tara:strand:+ start:361 stop:513 length:153 start_codon:yes stop_codon:yes gene_type:complete